MIVAVTPVPMAEVSELASGPGPLQWIGRVTFPSSRLEGWAWPLTVFRGAEAGPTVTVIGGTHGGEYVGMLATRKLAATIRPEDVRGTLYLLHVLNLPSFRGKTPFICPIDGKDPAVCFPGDPDGSFTEVMCHHVWQSFFKPSEAIFDLHGGDICEDVVPFTIMQITGNAELEARTEMVARAFELPLLLVWPLPPAVRKHLAVAGERGKVGVVVEIGGAGNATTAEVDLMCGSLLRSLGHLGVLPERPFRPEVTRKCRSAPIVAPREGFFTPCVRVGSVVEQGQLLGRVVDINGEWEDEIRAPVGGTVLITNRVPAAPKGGGLFGIGQVYD